MVHRLALVAVLDHLYREGMLGGAPRPRVEAIVGHDLPVWDCVIVERRFDGDPRVDVMGAICDRREGGLAPELAGAELLAGNTVFERWCRGGEDPVAASPLLWFEWDMVDSRPQAPLASICVSNAIVGGHAARQIAADPGARGRLLAAAAAALGDGRGESLWARALHSIVDALGSAGDLLHVAGLAPRGLARLRLTLHIEVAAIPRWLDRIGWPGDLALVAPLLALLTVLSRRICVQIELTPEVGPYLGFETQELRTLHDVARSTPHYQALTSVISLAPDALDDLARWPGIALLPGQGGEIQVLRHCYTKLVFQPGGAWLAKGYFGVTVLELTGVAPLGMKVSTQRAGSAAPCAIK
jgi:hypothetical protein